MTLDQSVIQICEFKGRLKVNHRSICLISTNVLLLPNLVRRALDQSVIHSWGQRQRKAQPDVSLPRMSYDYQIWSKKLDQSDIHLRIKRHAKINQMSAHRSFTNLLSINT